MDMTFNMTAKNASQTRNYDNNILGHTTIKVGTYLLFSLSAPSTINAAISLSNSKEKYVIESCSVDYKKNLTDKFLARINELGMLKDDWDYEGAKPILSAVCNNARTLIMCLPETVLKSLVIFPDVDGTLLFDIRSKNSHSTIFVCDKFFSYIIKQKSVNTETVSGCSWKNETDVNTMISKIETSLA